MSQFMFKQDLAMAYFPDRSKESASKRFAHEIHSWYACEHRLNQLTAVSNKPLLDALQATGNPERELSSAKLNQMKRRTPAPAKSSPQNNSKSSTPPSVHLGGILAAAKSNLFLVSVFGGVKSCFAVEIAAEGGLVVEA